MRCWLCHLLKVYCMFIPEETIKYISVSVYISVSINGNRMNHISCISGQLPIWEYRWKLTQRIRHLYTIKGCFQLPPNIIKIKINHKYKGLG